MYASHIIPRVWPVTLSQEYKFNFCLFVWCKSTCSDRYWVEAQKLSLLPFRDGANLFFPPSTQDLSCRSIGFVFWFRWVHLHRQPLSPDYWSLDFDLGQDIFTCPDHHIVPTIWICLFLRYFPLHMPPFKILYGLVVWQWLIFCSCCLSGSMVALTNYT